MDIEYLKYLAKSNDFKIYELGEKIGLSQHYFYKKIKRGSWDIYDMKKLIEVLKLSQNDFNKIFGFEFRDWV